MISLRDKSLFKSKQKTITFHGAAALAACLYLLFSSAPAWRPASSCQSSVREDNMAHRVRSDRGGRVCGSESGVETVLLGHKTTHPESAFKDALAPRSFVDSLEFVITALL